MRKILLGTTGVVGAALIGMGAAHAQQAPTVRIGGFMNTAYNWVNDDADKAQGVPTGVNGAGRVARSRHDFRNEVEVHVFVTGKAANGLSYGAVMEIQNDNVGGGSGSALDFDEAYGFVSSPTLGTLRFGEEDNAAAIMQVRVPTITGLGPDGDFDDGMLSLANSTGNASPSLLTGINDGNDSTKIIYLSPQFFGFDFGVSYAPTSSGEGERLWVGRQIDTLTVGGTGLPVSNTQRDRTAGRNELSGALRYRGSFGNVGVAAGFGAMFVNGAESTATGVPTSARNISAYTAGLNVTAFGFTLGGEYTWGNYSGVSVGRASLAEGRDSSNHWVLGATYTVAAWSFGGFYGVAKQDNGPGVGDREQTIWGVGTAYSLAPGLELFANYNRLKDENTFVIGTTPFNRDADVVYAGARLAF